MTPASIFRQIQHWMQSPTAPGAPPALRQLCQLLEHNDLLPRALQVRRAAIAIIDLEQGNYHYVCNLDHLLGHPQQAFYDKGVALARSLVHLPDLQALAALNQVIAPHMHMAARTAQPYFYNSFDLRFRHANGSLRRILQRNFALEFNPQTQRVKTQLTLLYDISHLRKRGASTLAICSSANRQPLLFNYIQADGQVQQQPLFTRREQLILQHLASGYSSVQIASQLQLSEHTVNTHRRNMLRKTGSANVLELIGFGHTAGLLDGFLNQEEAMRPVRRKPRLPVPSQLPLWLLNNLAALTGTVVWVMDAATFQIAHSLGSHLLLQHEPGAEEETASFYQQKLAPIYLAAAPAIFKDHSRYYNAFCQGMCQHMQVRYHIPTWSRQPEGPQLQQYSAHSQPIAWRGRPAQNSNMVMVCLYADYINIMQGRGVLFVLENEVQKDIFIVECTRLTGQQEAWKVKDMHLMEPLTQQEYKVLRYLMLGYDTDEVALLTGLMANTVHYYRNSLLRKTGCHDQVSLINMARLANLATTETLDEAELALLAQAAPSKERRQPGPKGHKIVTPVGQPLRPEQARGHQPVSAHQADHEPASQPAHAPERERSHQPPQHAAGALHQPQKPKDQ